MTESNDERQTRTFEIPVRIINNRYRLHERLGAGGMGAVYHATDRLNGQTVALKQVRPENTEGSPTDETQDLRLSLSREFRTLASLHHPHVIGVIDYGFGSFNDPDERIPYFTMELIENAQPITQFSVGLPTVEKLRLLVEMLQALAYVHRRGVIHRDLKPQNVLVDQAGTVKVLDFGLALGRGVGSLSDIDSEVAGTVAYMSPELFMNSQATVASDLYAVGMIAYEVFREEYPFNRKNIGLLLHSIMNTSPDYSAIDAELIPVISRLLFRDPDRRYPTAESVIEALCKACGQPVPEESAAVRESFLRAAQFVGREDELRVLKNALNHVAGIRRDTSSDATQTDLMVVVKQYESGIGDGAQMACLIGGESGVGKSRLVDELRVRAMIRGALVLRGYAVGEGGLPYHVWRDPLRRLLLEVLVSDLEAGILKIILPDIGTLLERDIPDAPELDGQAQRQRLARTVVDLFQRYREPVVLVLEDLQWVAASNASMPGGDESLELLKALLEEHDRLPHLLIIGTYRDEEAPGLPLELPDMGVLKLKRLDTPAIAQLSASMLGEIGLQHSVIDLLARETEGNVFFLIEVVRALAEDAGSLSQIGRGGLPKTVFAGGIQQVVRQRLTRVPPQYRDLLKLAAVAGRELDLKVLGTLITESAEQQADAKAEPIDLNTFLAACANAAVFELIDGHWRFTHDKLRDAVLQDLAAEERPLLHQKIAQTLEQTYPGDVMRAAALMEHWHMAGNAANEARYALTAGRQAEVVSNFPQALALAERGLSLNPSDKTRTALFDLAGDALYAQGDYAQASNRYQESLTLARDLTDHTGTAVALRGLGRVAAAHGDYEAARAYYTECLEIYRQINDRRGIASCLNRLGGIADIQGEFGTSGLHYQESLALYREIGNLRGIASSLNRLGVTTSRQGVYRAAQVYLEESLAIYRQIGDRRGIAACLSALGEVIAQRGQAHPAVDFLNQSLALYREIGDPRGMVAVLCNLAMHRANLQAMTDAAHNVREALQLTQALGVPVAALEAITAMARLEYCADKPEKSAELAGLVEAHPFTTPELRQIRLNPLLNDLKTALAPEKLAAALEHGKTLDLNTQIGTLIREYA